MQYGKCNMLHRYFTAPALAKARHCGILFYKEASMTQRSGWSVPVHSLAMMLDDVAR